MKIALLVPAMDLGGVEQGTFDLACGFQAAGHEPFVISGPGRYLPRLAEHRVRHYLVPMEQKSPLSFCLALHEVGKIIGAEKPDIVHCRSRLPAWIGRLTTRNRPGTHFVTSIHGFHRTRWYSRVMALGERVIIVSPGLRNHAIDFLGAAPEKIRVVYNGFDFAPFLTPTSSGKNEKVGTNEITVGAVGRLTVVKGYRYLLEAAAKLKTEIPGLQIVIVGEGPEERNLRVLAQDLQITEMVSFRQGKAAEFLGLFDVLCAPHLSPEPEPDEGPYWPGRTAAEAMIAGVPVVTTRQGVQPETFQPGKDQVYAGPADARGLALGIKYLLTNLKEKESLVDRAQKTARENFSLDGMVTRTLSVYGELLHQTESRPAHGS